MPNNLIARNIDFTNKNQIDFDFILWIVPFILVILSTILIASTQRNGFDSLWYLHLITAGFGFLLTFIFSYLQIERLRNFLIPLYFITLSGLLAVKLFGVSALGAQRWLSIGGINIQPSEIAKITLVIVLAHILETQKFRNLTHLCKPIIVVFFPWFLVFLQPDLGTSLVFGAVMLIMLYWAGMPFEWIILFLSGILTAIFQSLFHLSLFIWIPLVGYLAFRSLPKKYWSASFMMIFLTGIAFLTPWLWNNALKDYQRDRLTLFLDPTKDPLGGGVPSHSK